MPTTARSGASLEAFRPLVADPIVVCRALSDPGWLGRIAPFPAERSRHTRVETDLAFQLGTGERVLVFRKAAFLDIGTARWTPGGCVIDISWRASSLAPLFPVFSGRLTVRAEGLSLEGQYAPPGGGVGLVIDGTFVHYFARRTAMWFLDRIAAEVDRRQ